MRREKNHIRPLLSDQTLFRSLSVQDLSELEKSCSTLTLERNQMIYAQNDTPLHLFFLLRGHIKIGALSDDGREIIKLFHRPGALFGEFSLFDENVSGEYAVNIAAEAEVMAIPKKVFRQLMQRNPEFTQAFIHWVGQRLRTMESRLEGMILKDARERIIDFLVASAREQGEPVGYETLIRHSLTQKDIANFTGTSRQTVTSVLNELKKSNLIYFNRKSILIRDLAKLS